MTSFVVHPSAILDSLSASGFGPDASSRAARLREYNASLERMRVFLHDDFADDPTLAEEMIEMACPACGRGGGSPSGHCRFKVAPIVSDEYVFRKAVGCMNRRCRGRWVLGGDSSEKIEACVWVNEFYDPRLKRVVQPVHPPML